MALLAVDDNQAHCYSMCRILRHAGYHVFEAHTVTDALGIAQREILDLALVDVNLPDGNGYDLLTSFRKHPRTRSVAVIIHTATEPAQLARQRAELLGAAAFLTFPIEPRDLVNVVRGVLAKGEQRGDTAPQAAGVQDLLSLDLSLLPPDHQQPFRHLLGLSSGQLAESDVRELIRLLESTEILLNSTRVTEPYRSTIQELRAEVQRLISHKKKSNGDGSH
jgi:CheY-like chemotaxis protein